MHTARRPFSSPSPVQNFMKRIWLLFSQAVTVFVAAYFVVATLQPSWLGRGRVAK